jgi:hypothetical protein
VADVPTLEQLLAEGGSVPLEGWDFSWFEGRAGRIFRSRSGPAPTGS